MVRTPILAESMRDMDETLDVHTRAVAHGETASPIGSVEGPEDLGFVRPPSVLVARGCVASLAPPVPVHNDFEALSLLCSPPHS